MSNSGFRFGDDRVTGDPLARPDPTEGANWTDGHVPAPAGHAPRLGAYHYYLDAEVGYQFELREEDSGACIVVNEPRALCDLEGWR